MIPRTLFVEGGLANLGLVGEVKKEKLGVQDWRGEVPVLQAVGDLRAVGRSLLGLFCAGIGMWLAGGKLLG